MPVETKRERFVVDPRTVRLEGRLAIVATSINGVDTYQFVCDAAKLETVYTFYSKAIFEAAQAGTGGLAALRAEAEGALERYFGHRRLDPKNDPLVLGVLVERRTGGFRFNSRGLGVWGKTPPW